MILKLAAFNEVLETMSEDEHSKVQKAKVWVAMKRAVEVRSFAVAAAPSAVAASRR